MPKSPDFRRLFEASPSLYLILDPALRITAVTDTYLHATKTCRTEILGRGIFEVFPDNPDDAEATGVNNLRRSLEQVIKARKPDAMAVQKYPIRRPDSEGGGFEERFWSPINSPVLDDQGVLIYIIHEVVDVTDFLRLKEQERLQNQVTEELKAQAEKMEIEIYRRAQEIQEANRQLRVFQAELESRVEARTSELRRANQILHGEIEERIKAQESLKVTEEQLRQSQKMEAVGRLAGGIAHDFNNLLTVILSYCETAAERAPSHEIEAIERAARRAAGLTRQLLAFSRQQVLSPKVLDLGEVLRNFSDMLVRVLPEHISLMVQSSEDLWPMKADPGQIEQVLMNLVVNARDAMPEGGKLMIEAANIHLDEAYISSHVDIPPGDYIGLFVSDTGIGMDKGTQDRAFEPFFTTKAPGKGTGLGLATVFGTVKQSGGSILLYSEPGIGTTFKIYFPRAEDSEWNPEPKSMGPAEAIQTRNHSGDACRILLVEDEDQVRAVAKATLLQAGYEVVEASSGEAALALITDPGFKIDLLLTDVIMSGMNGRRLGESVRQRLPETPVLFMSGYTDDAILRHGVLDEGLPFLQKPFTPSMLLKKLAGVLTKGA